MKNVRSIQNKKKSKKLHSLLTDIPEICMIVHAKFIEDILIRRI